MAATEQFSKKALSGKLLGRRLLLKISGEALRGDMPFGLDLFFVSSLVTSIKSVQEQGYELNIVLGAGNFFRGSVGLNQGMTRVVSDNMGMLATMMNGVALQDMLKHHGLESVIISGVDCPMVAETFHYQRCQQYMAEGKILIFVGGSGSAYFTTDTAAVLRALEMGCDMVMKATQVDGVYSADPFKDPQAARYDMITYQDVLTQNLHVMDASAIALAKENNLNILIFSIHPPSNLAKIFKGQANYSLITAEESTQ